MADGGDGTRMGETLAGLPIKRGRGQREAHRWGQGGMIDSTKSEGGSQKRAGWSSHVADGKAEDTGSDDREWTGKVWARTSQFLRHGKEQ